VDHARLCQHRTKLRAVGARIGYGAAWGALPAGVATAAGIDGNLLLAVLFGLVAFCGAVLAPLAPFLPVLNRIPLVGSPRVDVVFRLDGRRDLTLTETAGQVHTCILEVEITNMERWAEVKGAWMNLLIPSGIKLGCCDQRGEINETGGGKWEHFHRHQLGVHARADYWAEIGLNLPPRLTRVMRFKLRLGHSEEDHDYPILLKLAAPSLYRVVEAEAIIKVRQGEPDLATRMGRVITTGETTLEEFEEGLLSMSPEGRERGSKNVAKQANPLLAEAIANDPLPQTPQDIKATTPSARIHMYLTALYVVRNELGRKAD
jgi:hypothetical protein